ncbi:tyrosine-type recombinase/integrase [Candidatus Bipolaricaulota bacterium]|nr:tyrosine-type recombinase/integrase [Candidatus Bipolaricaulota bacterium]
MNSSNQARVFAAEEDYFQPPKSESSPNQNSVDGEEHTLTEAIDDFKLRGKVEGRADKTLQQYDYVLGRFSEKLSGDRNLNSLEAKDIREYLAYLMDDGLADTSVAIHYRVLRAFFNWSVSEGYIAESPVNEINEPKTPDKFPKTLDQDEVEKLLDTARNWRRTWAGYRNFTMLVTFLDTGLRLKEFLNARLENLDLEQRSIKVEGKGAKDRRVYFGKNNYRCLRHWLKMRREIENIIDETIFISQNGDKLKRRHVQHIISRIQKEAGLEDVQVSPHVLRHTAATLAVQNGLDAFSLKRQFGWEQMSTALKYVHMSDKALQESCRNSSPMDNLES